MRYINLEHHPNDSRIRIVDDGICQTLNQRMGTGGGNVPLVLEIRDEENIDNNERSVWCIGNGQLDQLKMSEKVGALNCMHDQQAVLMRWGENIADNCKTVARRLTPLECERLQGFPDGWADIGEWVDSKGKKHKDADSPRYKALGNSIATPFWFYLLRRIAAQYERPATLGSLFDGIGGFPYCWERCNGKGTAIWASEIEEFPIAVTKLRFPEE